MIIVLNKVLIKNKLTFVQLIIKITKIIKLKHSKDVILLFDFINIIHLFYEKEQNKHLEL